MKVRVEQSADGRPRATVEDATDFGRLVVELVGVDEAPGSRALAAAGLGEMGDGHAWLDLDALKAAAVAASERGFDEMVRYAAGRGWVADDGRRVRAHCESVTTGTPSGDDEGAAAQPQ